MGFIAKISGSLSVDAVLLQHPFDRVNGSLDWYHMVWIAVRAFIEELPARSPCLDEVEHEPVQMVPAQPIDHRQVIGSLASDQQELELDFSFRLLKYRGLSMRGRTIQTATDHCPKPVSEQ